VESALIAGQRKGDRRRGVACDHRGIQRKRGVKRERRDRDEIGGKRSLLHFFNSSF